MSAGRAGVVATLLDPCGGPWCQRWDGGRSSWRDVRTDERVRRGRYRAVAVPEATARRYVLAHHYAGTMPATRRCYGYLDNEDGHLAGVAVLGVPMSGRVLTAAFRLEPYTESLELSRFVCGPEVPANGESNFLGQIFALAAEEGVRGLVCFADPVERRRADGTIVKPGHVGVIYSATNAVYAGRSTARSLVLLPDGTVFSDRAASKVRRRDRGWRYAVDQLVDRGATAPGPAADLTGWLPKALAEIGAQRVRHPGNHRYLFALGRNRTERRSVELLMQGEPYPKAA